MTLVEFLRARLDEDAAEIAKQPDGQGEPGGIGIWSSGDVLSNTEYLILSKRRALAEVEARRRIVKAFESNNNYELYGGCGDDCEWGALDYALKALALPYADHPDHRKAWRP